MLLIYLYGNGLISKNEAVTIFKESVCIWLCIVVLPVSIIWGL